MIQYSLLTSDRTILADKERVQGLLRQGIKVIAFGSASDLEGLSIGAEKYREARLLQLYTVQKRIPVFTIEDGKLDRDTRRALEKAAQMAPEFNCEQYLIDKILWAGETYGNNIQRPEPKR